MESKTIDYPAEGTLDDLSRTCGGDEDVFRGPLAKLEQVQDGQGKKATRATYNPIPFEQDYVKKKLFFFDTTNATSAQEHDISVQQLELKHALVDNWDVYLSNNPARVAVYREQ